MRDSTEDGRPGAFWVVGELDYQTLRQLEWTAGARAEVVVLAADGTEVTSRTVDLKAEDGPFGIQVPETGGIASGEYAIRVRIRSLADEKAELIGTSTRGLERGLGAWRSRDVAPWAVNRSPVSADGRSAIHAKRQAASGTRDLGPGIGEGADAGSQRQRTISARAGQRAGGSVWRVPVDRD